MKINVLTQQSKPIILRFSEQKKSEDMARFAAIQLKALKQKKLSLPIRLGHL